MRAWNRAAWLAFFLAAALYSCGPRIVKGPERVEVEEKPRQITRLDYTPTVRVLIDEGAAKVRVRIPSAFLVGSSEADGSLTRFDRGGDFSVTFDGNALQLGEGTTEISKGPALLIKNTSERNVYINGKPYRGDFLFKAVHGSIVTVNIIEVDDYVKGVLPAEIGYLKGDQFEAYRAQAIASRSYALSKLAEKEADLYDVQATIMDQVYKGVVGESPEASRAVDGTRGLVAVWEGEPARTYYSSCCGGHTADIRVCWPWKIPYAYLYGTRDAGEDQKGKSFCSRSPHFRWRIYWSGSTLEQVLRETLPRELKIKPEAVGELQDIEVDDTAPDGRVRAVTIVTDRGTYRIEGDRIRWILRPDASSDKILNSTMFKLSVKKGRGRVLSVNLVGGGNGHGVGMCQTGAVRMAELGYSAKEILEHYYPGVSIFKYYD